MAKRKGSYVKVLRTEPGRLFKKVPKERRISAFERGLVTWIDESYDPDSNLNGFVPEWDKRVNFED